METLALIIFFVATAIHLYASIKTNKKLRNYTKPFILTSLLAYYCFSTQKINIFVVLALIFSWIGDVFLIIPGVKWFTIGGISFEISHVFFILSYRSLADLSCFYTNTTYKIIAHILMIIFFIIVSIIFKYLKKYLPKSLFYPMYMYLFVNGLMNCYAIFRYMSNNCLSNLLTCIGAILFFISDSTLFFVRFKKDAKQKNHFWVMLTYSIGEFLIVLGLI